MRPWARTVRRILVSALLLAGCASFDPKPLAQVPFPARAETQEKDGLRVTVAVPTRGETRRIFGVDLERKKIQPVWIRVQNTRERPVWLMLNSLDPNYFSAREAAYRFHGLFRKKRNCAIDLHLEGLAVQQHVLPRCRSEGFAFTHVKRGAKQVRIRLVGDNRVVDFEFHLLVPGLRADWHAVDWRALYPRGEVRNIEDDETLWRLIVDLPKTTSGKKGEEKGDPLNLVVIGDLSAPFLRADWDQTERLSPASAWRAVKGFFGKEYKNAPISSLYVFGRPQDIGLQKARDSIRQRNHLRLWLTPYLYRGKPVWLGTITRDIGVTLTPRAWNLMTHAIDPDVDEARDYLADDLAAAESLERYDFVPGVEPAAPERPHRNLMNDPYWTDGQRVLLLVSDDVVRLDRIDTFGWGHEPGRQACDTPLL